MVGEIDDYGLIVGNLGYAFLVSILFYLYRGMQSMMASLIDGWTVDKGESTRYYFFLFPLDENFAIFCFSHYSFQKLEQKKTRAT